MIKNDWVTYIFGDWPHFILFLFTYLTAIVGITFLGGSFIHTSSPTQKVPPVNTDSGDLEGFSLYLRFLRCSWDLLKQNINLVTVAFFTFVNGIHKTITLFLLPLLLVFIAPFIYPMMLFLTIMGIANITLQGNQRFLPFPPSSWEYFCEGCNEHPWYIYGLWDIPTYYLSTFLLFFVNIGMWSIIAGAGCIYFLWYILFKPFSDYIEIFKIIFEYSNTLLFLVVLIFFIACSFLGYPLKMASIAIFIVSLLLLFFDYLKSIYLRNILTQKV